MPIAARGSQKHGPEPAALLLAPPAAGVSEQTVMVHVWEGNAPVSLTGCTLPCKAGLDNLSYSF